jgi:hypothetical protein
MFHFNEQRPAVRRQRCLDIRPSLLDFGRRDVREIADVHSPMSCRCREPASRALPSGVDRGAVHFVSVQECEDVGLHLRFARMVHEVVRAIFPVFVGEREVVPRSGFDGSVHAPPGESQFTK